MHGARMNETSLIIEQICQHYPSVQAIYLFGSYGTEHVWPSSDVDIALLFAPMEAKPIGALSMSELRFSLERLLHRDVDLVNLRLASTVFQKEVIIAERRVYCADAYAAAEFEMLVFSFYQKLNEERAGILADGLRDGCFYAMQKDNPS